MLHLLLRWNDPTVSTLASQIKHKMTGLTALRSRLAEMKAYLEAVVAEKIPANNQILYNCQAIFNLMPNLNQDALVESMLVKTNDYHLAVYCASLVRCIIALHELVNNKIQNKRLEEEEEAKAEGEKRGGKRGEEGWLGQGQGGRGAGPAANAPVPLFFSPRKPTYVDWAPRHRAAHSGGRHAAFFMPPYLLLTRNRSANPPSSPIATACKTPADHLPQKNRAPRLTGLS